MKSQLILILKLAKQNRFCLTKIYHVVRLLDGNNIYIRV